MAHPCNVMRPAGAVESGGDPRRPGCFSSPATCQRSVTDLALRPAGFLLDLDGVLVRSHELHLAAYETAFAEHGLELSDDVRALVLRGRGRASVIRHTGLPPDVADSLSRRKEEAFKAAVRAGRLEPMPGAEDFLRRLHDARCPAVVVSNSWTARMCVESMGWAWALRDVVGRADVSVGKPDPEPFRVGAERLGVAAHRCVAVEDSAPGAESARAAGAFVVGVGERIEPENVDYRVDELAEIPLDRWLDRSEWRAAGEAR